VWKKYRKKELWFNKECMERKSVKKKDAFKEI
jgi:hypothetical protein